ncbi:MAG: vWA domain-containing protein [Thermoguttaceae bacterium]
MNLTSVGGKTMAGSRFLGVAGGSLLSWMICVGTLAAAEESGQTKGKEKTTPVPKAQLALLLDTSNSMDGLIDQAKTQLWAIVGEFTRLELGGKSPRLEVALYEYGNSGLPASKGFIRQVVPLTDDVDRISEALFALTTNGGDEYCGQVIQVATGELRWSSGPRDLKAIFIAGNEPFTQGEVDYRAACKAAADKGITVSTIHCGDRQTGIATQWEDGAKLADGSYFCINQDHKTYSMTAPQDPELLRLSGELNTTYLPFGARRQEAVNRQAAQDLNAVRSAASTAAARAGFKASAQYRNAGWDLVDAVADNSVKLEALPAEQLPEAMQSMDGPARAGYVAEMAKKRQTLQAKIRQLSQDRDAYVAKERARLEAESPAKAAAAAAPLAEAVRDAIQAQAAP